MPAVSLLIKSYIGSVYPFLSCLGQCVCMWMVAVRQGTGFKSWIHLVHRQDERFANNNWFCFFFFGNRAHRSIKSEWVVTFEWVEYFFSWLTWEIGAFLSWKDILKNIQYIINWRSIDHLISLARLYAKPLIQILFIPLTVLCMVNPILPLLQVIYECLKKISQYTAGFPAS